MVCSPVGIMRCFFATILASCQGYVKDKVLQLYPFFLPKSTGRSNLSITLWDREHGTGQERHNITGATGKVEASFGSRGWWRAGRSGVLAAAHLNWTGSRFLIPDADLKALYKHNCTRPGKPRERS